MKRFVFSLEAVRTVRRRAEQQASLSYARTLGWHQEQLEKLRRAAAAAAAAWAEARNRLGGAITALELDRLAGHARQAEEARGGCAAAAAESQRALEAAAAQWREARRQCELVETYLRKQRANYDRALCVEEQKMLDELANRSGGLRTSLSFEAGKDAYDQAA